MIIEIDNKLISSEIFERKFVCDLNACKGACCVEGDQGAPLMQSEIEELEAVYEQVKPFMRKEGIEAVEKNGVYYNDPWNAPAVSLVDGKECAFVYFDDKGITKCAIEQAYLSGLTNWKKPISCHLYPIRMSKIGENLVLNYDEWNICNPACVCGEKLNVPTYKFLKEPIIRAFGETFYADMVEVDKELNKQTD
jgi:hypothetical protein